MTISGDTLNTPTSLSEMIEFFGGGTKLSDFTRGGGLVPSQIGGGTIEGDWSSFQFNELFPQTYVVTGGDLYWNGSLISGAFPSGGTGTANTYGGYQYQAGALQNDSRRSVRRRTIETLPPESVNEGIPSSPPLKMSDFDGAARES